MSGLFSSLTMAARSLEAQRAGLDVAGQNIANLNTPGYARRQLRLAEVVNGTGGVEVQGTRALRDRLLDARVRDAVPDESREGAIAETLAVVETAIGAPGTALDADLAAFFDAFAALSDDPTSAVARDAVVEQGKALAASFNDLAGQLSSGRRVADNGIRDAVTEVNALAAEIAEINTAISAAAGVDVAALKDRQHVAVEALSKLTAVSVLTRADGGMDVTIPSGRALVIGSSSHAMTVSSGAGGMATIALGGYDVTGELPNGRIGGLLQVRDALVPAYQQQLDEVAFAVAQEVNTLHQAGFDLNGAAGVAFFAPPAGVAGAAAGLTVSSALQADPSLVAASQSGSAGDNQNARAIAALRDAKVLAGGTATFTEGWARLAYQVGTDVATADRQQGSRNDVLRQVQLLRDQVSGVSLDEETASLLKFQRSYEANAKYFATVDSLLDTLMNLAGV